MPRGHRNGWIVGCLAGMLAAGACGFPDFAVSQTDAATGGTGAGGEAAVTDAPSDLIDDRNASESGGCSTDRDCAPSPSTPLCETESATCVACLADGRGCAPGTYCDPSRICQIGCSDDEACAPLRCELEAHECVGCNQNAECPPGTLCETASTKCTPGCTKEHPCPAGFECCDGACVDLKTDRDHCGECGLPCYPPSAAGACSNGACRIANCESGFTDCDGLAVTGCEANLLVDPAHCGGCRTACSSATPECASGTCQPGASCPDDAWEPNEVIQPPALPPMAAEMKPMSPADNLVKLSDPRKLSITPGFHTASDVDVFHLEVLDDAAGKNLGYEIAVAGIPTGATYRVDSYYHCFGTGGARELWGIYGEDCYPDANPNSGFVGRWWWCQRDSVGPKILYWSGIDCPSASNSGILQVRVRVLTPPTDRVCQEYELAVRIFAI
jgi:hypothetical protein